MTTVRISVQAPEGDVTVQIDRDTVTVSELCGQREVTPSVCEVLEDAVRRARAAYAAGVGRG